MAVAARPIDAMHLSRRDREIIALARTMLCGTTASFGEAVRALQDAVEQLIPDGRLFVLGTAEHGPIVGSLRSGVGIVERDRGIELVRVRADGEPLSLGWFAR